MYIDQQKGFENDKKIHLIFFPFVFVDQAGLLPGPYNTTFPSSCITHWNRPSREYRAEPSGKVDPLNNDAENGNIVTFVMLIPI